MKLRWEDGSTPGAFFGYCGDLLVGMVIRPSFENPLGVWRWQIDAVFMRHTGKSAGDGYTSVKNAQAALERNWNRWLDRAKLEPAA